MGSVCLAVEGIYVDIAQRGERRLGDVAVSSGIRKPSTTSTARPTSNAIEAAVRSQLRLAVTFMPRLPQGGDRAATSEPW